jgi:cellulase/cellobiase CelA1
LSGYFTVLAALFLTLVVPSTFAQTHVANPYVGAKVYVSPDWTTEVATAVATEPAGSTLAQQMAIVGNTPTFIWMDHIGAIYGGAAGGGRLSLAQHIAAAATQAAGAEIVVQLVIYDLPDRDCAALASNGELSIAGGDTVTGPTGAKETLTGTGLQEYENYYITPIYQALAAAPSNIRFVLVIEDDSLPNIVTNTGYSYSLANCVAANGGQSYPTYSTTGVYVQGIQYALNQFHSLPNAYNYLDIGHHGWLGWPQGAALAFPFYASVIKGTTAQFASLDGIITNTANYGPTKEPYMTAFTEPPGTITGTGTTCASPEVCSGTFYSYNAEIDEADYAQEFYTGLTAAGFPSTLGFLIDTSRNGWGGSLRPTGQGTSTVIDTFVNETKIDQRDDMGQWCNQENQGIGSFPTVNPGGATNMQAYVWVKPPGESDGDYPNGDTNAQHLALGASHGDENCDPAHGNTLANGFAVNSIPNSPPAGTFWLTEFLQDVQNAYPPIPVGSGFSITTTPVSVVQAKTGTSSVTVSEFGGFSGTVALSLSTLPAGVTAAFSPTSVTGSAGSTLTFTVSATAVPGTYPLTVTGTSGSTVETASLSLVVAYSPQFLITASSPTVSLPVGTNPTDTFTITFLGGLTGSVSVSATGLPSGMQANFSPSSVNAPGGTIVANFSAQSSTPAGSYPIKIVGTNGTVTNFVTITITIPATGFTLAASPTTLTVTQGTSGTDTIAVTDLPGFTGTVSFNVSGLPSGVTSSFSPASSTTSTVLTLTAITTATTGAFTVSVTGTSGSNTATTSFTLNVVSGTGTFTLKPSATTLSVAQGASGTDTITVTDVSPFTGSVTFAATGQPTGVTAAFSPTSSTTSSVLTLTAGSTAAAGTYTITVTGTSGTLTPVITTFTLTVTSPTGGFTLHASSPTVTVVAGASGTDTITVADISPFTGIVAFSASGLATGITGSFNPASSATSTVLTLTVPSTAALGTSTVTITGTSGTLTPVSITIALTVTSPTGGFTLKPSATALTVAPGASGTGTITVTDISPFTGTVAFAATGQPTGVTAAFSPTSSATSSVLTLTVGSSTAAGTYTITVTGTSGTLTPVTTSLTLTVTGTSKCTVDYTISSQWQGGFGAALAIVNNGSTALTSWTLTWTFANGQTITQLWNGVETQSGANVTVKNMSYNGSIPAGGTLSGMGFNGTWNNTTNAIPTAISLNGTACTVN